MRILVTNDDGISSPHLQALAHRLKQDHDVWVCAPSKEQSASSHAITLRKPLIIEKKDENQFACSGTPADCILLFLNGYMNQDFDLVISGINRGPNLGTDIIYSGTVAGARQGAIMGTPSLAISVNSPEPDLDITYHTEFICRNITAITSLWKPGSFININLPEKCTSQAQVELTFPSKRVYRDQIIRFEAPDGKTYCFFDGKLVTENEKGSDFYSVERNNISLSLIAIQPVHNDVNELFQTVSFWKGENGS